MEGGPDGQAQPTRQRPLRRRRLDRLRRTQVALVHRLRHHRRARGRPACTSRASTSASSSRAASSTTSASLQARPRRPTSTRSRTAVADTGIDAAASPIVNTSGETIRVQTEEVDNDQADQVSDAIAQAVDVDAQNDISATEVGASWGEQVAKRALTGLVVFLILVVLFIWAYFREWKMSVAAIVALAHDIVITIGVYALSGFEVTPGHRHRSADHPRFLALRHRGRLRQGQGEHPQPAPGPSYVRRAGQPRGQPDPGALDQHLDRGAAAGGRDPLRQRRHPRLGCAQGPVARAVRRHGGRCLLLDLHRDAARRTAEGEREGDHPAGRPRQGARPPRRRPLRRRAVLHRGHALARRRRRCRRAARGRRGRGGAGAGTASP